MTVHAATMMGWISEIVAFGIRTPGSGPGREVEDWLTRQLGEAGVDDVTSMPVDVPVWEPASACVRVWPAGAPHQVRVIDGFALPHTLPTGGLRAPLVAAGSPEEDWSGAIVLDNVAMADLPQALLDGIALGRHDPDDEFASHVQRLPFGPREQAVLEPYLAAGAAGYVGVVANTGFDTCNYYVPYDGVERPISGLWISESDGETLHRLLSAGDVEAEIVVDARRRHGTTRNIVGVLPGQSDDWLIVGTHHDAPWASAVEDASGVALLLAQAAHWAGVPAEQRPHNILFLCTGGHMAHAAGTSAFIASHGALLERTVAEIHLEHVAAEVVGRDGALSLTGEPEVRWWFTTEHPALVASVQDALARHDLRRSWILPPTAFMDHPPTDGGFFFYENVPLVNLLAAPVYLFDRADTIDKVHEPSLEPLSGAVIDIITDLGSWSADDLRATVVVDRAAG